MKNKILIFIILVNLIGFFAVNNFPIRAADEGYILLEPLPWTENVEGGELSTYLESLFVFGISIAGILAVLMIVIGGIQYMTAYGNPGKVGDAKNRIYQALLGLLLAISAWLILYTINPDLVKGVLTIPPITSLPSPM